MNDFDVYADSCHREKHAWPINRNYGFCKCGKTQKILPTSATQCDPVLIDCSLLYSQETSATSTI